MTRELKLALIVGFALVLVVTVLISDHLSHARSTKLATLPSEPAKVTEPPPIALENGADTLPLTTVTEPAPNAPAPLIGMSMPSTDPEPVIIAQGTRSPANGAVNGLAATPTGPSTIDLINPMPQGVSPVPQGTTPTTQTPANAFAANPPGNRGGSLEEAVAQAGGEIRDNTILIPGVQTTRENVPNAQRAASSPAPVIPAPTTVLPPAPVSTDRVHTVAGGEHLFKICKQYYGDGKAWRKLATYNNIDANTPLKIGQKLKVPTSETLLGRPATGGTLAQASPERPGLIPGARAPVVEPRPSGTPTAGTTPAAPRTRPYTVKKGDSLALIAQRELGTVKRAKDILELNRRVIKNPDSVPLGATIQLPAA